MPEKDQIRIETSPVDSSSNVVQGMASEAVKRTGMELPGGQIVKKGDSVVVPFADELSDDPDSQIPAHVVGRPMGSESKVLVLPTGPFESGYPHGLVNLMPRAVKPEHITVKSRSDEPPKV